MIALLCQRSRVTVLLALFFLVNCIYVNRVESQNSIKPRHPKSKGVLTCPDVRNLSESPACKMACLRDDHCENHGEKWCCPAAAGSSCKAECQTPILTMSRGGTCYDFEIDHQYRVGHVFIRDAVCCTCVEGGRMNCTAIDSCVPGCYYGSSYYNNGEALSKSSCRNCSCHNGSVACTWNTNCTQDKCKYRGKVFRLEHVLRLDNGCKECVCQYEGWQCNAITCKAAISSSTSPVILSTQQSMLFGLVCLLQYLLQRR